MRVQEVKDSQRENVLVDVAVRVGGEEWERDDGEGGKE